MEGFQVEAIGGFGQVAGMGSNIWMSPGSLPPAPPSPRRQENPVHGVERIRGGACPSRLPDPPHWVLPPPPGSPQIFPETQVLLSHIGTPAEIMGGAWADPSGPRQSPSFLFSELFYSVYAPKATVKMQHTHTHGQMSCIKLLKSDWGLSLFLHPQCGHPTISESQIQGP